MDVIENVDVIAPVVVAALVNRNDAVALIDPVSDHARPSVAQTCCGLERGLTAAKLPAIDLSRAMLVELGSLRIVDGFDHIHDVVPAHERGHDHGNAHDHRHAHDND